MVWCRQAPEAIGPIPMSPYGVTVLQWVVYKTQSSHPSHYNSSQTSYVGKRLRRFHYHRHSTTPRPLWSTYDACNYEDLQLMRMDISACFYLASDYTHLFKSYRIFQILKRLTSIYQFQILCQNMECFVSWHLINALGFVMVQFEQCAI